MNDLTTVTLIEDDVAMRRHFAESLAEDEEFHVLAACGSCADAKSAMASEMPDVLVTDLRLPDGHGFDLIELARRELPETEIMVVSVLGDETTVVKAITLGASGYLLKDASPIDVRDAVRNLKAGRSPISTSIARYIVKSIQARTAGDPSQPAPVSLTERERDILWAIAKGFSYKEIARNLEMSHHTVPTHIKNIYRKLEVHSRGEAVFEALQSGLIALN